MLGDARGLYSWLMTEILLPEENRSEIARALTRLEALDYQPGVERVNLYPANLESINPRISSAAAPALIGLYGLPGSGKHMLVEYLASRYYGIRRLTISSQISAELNDYFSGKPNLARHRISAANKGLADYKRVLQEWGLGRWLEHENYWIEKTLDQAALVCRDDVQILFIAGCMTEADVRSITASGGQIWQVIRPGRSRRARHRLELNLAALKSDQSLINAEEGNYASFEAAIETALEDLRAVDC